jgi:hypothetical protein
MNDQRPVPPPEQPRSEPEIIPPGEADSRSPWGSVWRSRSGSQRVYVAHVGPFGFGLVALAVALIAALMFLLVLGAFVVLIPLAGLVFAALVIAGMLRGSFRRW